MELPGKLSALHAELGIPADYAASRGAALYPEALDANLVEIALNPDGRPVRLIQPAAEAWHAMRQTAAADHLSLVTISGFRSIARQAEIIRAKLAAGSRLEGILRYVAAPGYSEHHTGRALDIGSPEHIELDEDFARTAAFAWLDRHAARFGFRLTYPKNNAHGIGYEPWHWCWHPEISAGA